MGRRNWEAGRELEDGISVFVFPLLKCTRENLQEFTTVTTSYWIFFFLKTDPVTEPHQLSREI